MASAPLRLAMVGPSRRGAAEHAVARAVLGARHGVADEDDLAAHRGVGRGISASMVSKPMTSASMPCGGVAPLLPSAVTTSGCGKGAVISGLLLAAHPDRHVERLDADVGEAERASACATAQSRARASASVPARRGPTSVVRPSTMSQAKSSLSAASRRRSMCGGTGGGGAADCDRAGAAAAASSAASRALVIGLRLATGFAHCHAPLVEKRIWPDLACAVVSVALARCGRAGSGGYGEL